MTKKQLVVEYYEKTQEKKRLEKELEAMKKELIQKLDLESTRKVTIEGITLTYTESIRENVSNDALKAYDLDLFNELKNTILVGTLRVTK